MSAPTYVFIAHGINNETVQLQPWRYLYELAVRMSRNGRVVFLTDAKEGDRQEQWADNLTVIFTNLLSPRRQESLISYINGLDASQVWWSTTPRSIIYFRAWKKLASPVMALITCPLYSWSILLRARITGVPENELRALFQQRMIPRFLFVRLLNMLCVRRVIVQSQSNRDVLVESGVQEKKVAVLPVGIDPEDRHIVPAEHVRDVRGRYGFLENAIIFAYMGAVRKIRGIDVLLNAFSRVAENSPRACLAVFARGADEETVHQLGKRCAALGFGDRVKIIGGWLSREQVHVNIEASDVVVLPFVLVPSDVPIAILEALARGRPVIGTRVDGIPELIEGRGLVVDSMSETQLADAMISIAQGRVDYLGLSQAATEYMNTYPDWDQVFTMTEGLAH